MVKIGKYEISVLVEGRMSLDGGSVFGLIPKTLWEKKLPSDSRNRVAIGLNQLLIKGPTENILIDTGVGSKLSQRRKDAVCLVIQNDWEARLGRAGIHPNDITHVVFTHLHFDHSGGATYFDQASNEVKATFPNARHFIQSGEWNDSMAPNERGRSSYKFEDFLPIQSQNRLCLLSGDQEIAPFVRVFITGGHTRFHQAVVIESDNRRVVAPGDLFPTSFHLSPAWETSFDQYPQDSLRRKKALLNKYVNTDTLFFFPHDLDHSFKQIRGSIEFPEAFPVRL